MLPANFCFLLVSSVATSSQLNISIQKQDIFVWSYIKNYAVFTLHAASRGTAHCSPHKPNTSWIVWTLAYFLPQARSSMCGAVQLRIVPVYFTWIQNGVSVINDIIKQTRSLKILSSDLDRVAGISAGGQLSREFHSLCRLRKLCFVSNLSSIRTIYTVSEKKQLLKTDILWQTLALMSSPS